jgi:hypothetical protein
MNPRCVQCKKVIRQMKKVLFLYIRENQECWLHFRCEKDYEKHKGEKIDDQSTQEISV